MCVCAYISYTAQSRACCLWHALTVGNSTVSPCSSAKYLGQTIDNRLTFSSHIDLLVGKIAGKLKTFQRARNSLDNRARRCFYISLIQTSLLYGSNAFSPCLSITHVNRLITISKRAQRISFGYPPSAHTAPFVHATTLSSLTHYFFSNG